MTNLVNRSWEEYVLINDAFGEKFSLNNLLTFQVDISSHVVKNENQALSGNQSEIINQGANLSNFRYPTASHFPRFLLPPERPLNEQNDSSRILILHPTSLEEEVERNLSEASQKRKLPMPRGEGSSKQVDHSDTISFIEANIDEVFRDF